MERGFAKRRTRGLGLSLLALWLACTRAPNSSAEPEAGTALWLPDELGVARGVALLESAQGLLVVSRREGPDESYPAGALGHLLGAIAAVESGTLEGGFSVHCDGSHCLRTHGEVSLTQALRESCNQYFGELGRRLGTNALGATAGALGQSLPPLDEAPSARAQLVERGVPWQPRPRELLALARSLSTPPAWWPGALHEALVLDDRALRGGLRAFVVAEEGQGWLVGFEPSQRRRLVIHLSGCGNDCGVRALRVARWVLRRGDPSEPTARDGSVEGGTPRGRRTREPAAARGDRP